MMKYKSIILILLICTGCNSGGLNSEEEKLIQTLEFDKELVQILKSETQNPIMQLPAISKENGNIQSGKYPGIYSEIDKKRPIKEIFEKNKALFLEKGYQLFVLTLSGNEIIFLGLMKTKDKYEVLTYRGTNGLNKGVSNEAIIQQLKAWEGRYDYYLAGCGKDWVELQLSEPPNDLAKLISEIHEISDGSLMEALEFSNRIILSWGID